MDDRHKERGGEKIITNNLDDFPGIGEGVDCYEQQEPKEDTKQTRNETRKEARTGFHA